MYGTYVSLKLWKITDIWDLTNKNDIREYIKYTINMTNVCFTERGGSVVTHETRIRRSRIQIPWLANLVEDFSGFLNLKIAKELVIFKDKCRVGPRIPLLLIQYLMFTVSRDLKPLLSKW